MIGIPKMLVKIYATCIIFCTFSYYSTAVMKHPVILGKFSSQFLFGTVFLNLVKVFVVALL